MKKRLLPGLMSISMLLLATCIIAQPPHVTWEDFSPGAYELGNYTANDIKQSPYGAMCLWAAGMVSVHKALVSRQTIYLVSC